VRALHEKAQMLGPAEVVVRSLNTGFGWSRKSALTLAASGSLEIPASARPIARGRTACMNVPRPTPREVPRSSFQLGWPIARRNVRQANPLSPRARMVGPAAEVQIEMKIDFELAFAQPVEVVFPYVSDPSTYGAYVPAVIERTLTGDGPVGPGSVWRAVDKVGPLRIEFTEELVDIDAGRRVLWRHGSPWNASTECLVEPTQDGSVLTVHFTANFTGRLRWLDLLPNALAGRVFRADFERLRRLLDSGALPR